MMWFNILVLLISALGGGLIAYRLRIGDRPLFGLVLVFSGAYLFGITLFHLLPEIFAGSTHLLTTAGLVLAGFYLQQVFEFLTSGAEHGHLHQPAPDHCHSPGMAWSLMAGLSLHALLEGSVLGRPVAAPAGVDWPLLAGIALHKVPAAFAMMTVLHCQYPRGLRPVLLLGIFALASPAGVALGHYAGIAAEAGDWLLALVSGSFLHISTTIVYEGSPRHQFSPARLMVSLLGALLAVGITLATG